MTEKSVLVGEKPASDVFHDVTNWQELFNALNRCIIQSTINHAAVLV